MAGEKVSRCRPVFASRMVPVTVAPADRDRAEWRRPDEAMVPPSTTRYVLYTLIKIISLAYPNLIATGRCVMQSTILLVRAVAITATMIAAMNGLLNPNEAIALFSLKVAAILALILGGYLFGEFARFLQHSDNRSRQAGAAEFPRSVAMAAE
jgi:hypothetical protein